MVKRTETAFRSSLLRRWPLLVGCVLLVSGVEGGVIGPPRADATHAPLEGFGGHTPGGTGQREYRVTTRADDGPGSLRDAVARGYRYVRFDVAGDILLRSPLVVNGPFVTVDGLSAPPPGITLRRHGIVIRLEPHDGLGGAHDVIVRGIRIRDANATDSTDCIAVMSGAYNVVLDHVSTEGCSDGAIDLTRGARDVTVQWSILHTASDKTMLIFRDAKRLSVHHNLFAGSATRNPKVANNGFVTTDTILDLRNNVVWGWGSGDGTTVRDGAWANVVANVYANPDGPVTGQRKALRVCTGERRCAPGYAYAEGNLSLDGVDLDRAGNVDVAFDAPSVTTTDACTAARQVVAHAGVPPRDATDVSLVEAVRLTGCRDGGESGTRPTGALAPAPSPARQEPSLPPAGAHDPRGPSSDPER